MGWLYVLNRWRHQSITDPRGPIVSLTTYGVRAEWVYMTIESIARGRVLPSRIILWVDEQEYFQHLPGAVRRLQQRGLEIRRCDNYGAHKKYYPYLLAEKQFDRPLVLADDDQLYTRRWLEDLVTALREHPRTVSCHWGVVVGLSGDRIDRYMSWKRCASTESSFRFMAHGVSGVIYPPSLLSLLKHAGCGFRELCPKGDDLWLHVHAMRSGFKIRQVRKKKLECLQIVGSQRSALARENNAGGNDRQIAATYTPRDIEIMLTD